MRRWIALGPVALALATPARGQEFLPDPSAYLGKPIGADSVLADWSEIGRYLSALAGASSYVRLDTIGTSTLGRPLLLVTLTAPDNQARLDAIRRGQALLADPRQLTPAAEDSLIRDAPVVVLINNNLHSTEIGSSQFALLLAHRLASDPRYRSYLRDMVVLLSPSANPDGLDMVVDWYRRYRDTPYAAGPLPWLYHHYVGHDNNRDWYMLTQVETRALTRVLYREWYPQIVWDLHQMRNRGARMFLPPFADPVNPNLDPLIVEGTSLVGTAMAAAILEAGRTGVEHRARFDLWWHGGFRTVPIRHNMIGILTEVASADVASPIFQASSDLRQDTRGVDSPSPWEGGWWRLGDIVAYELLAADGLLRLAAGERDAFLRRFVTAGRRAVAAGEAGAPFAYLIPPRQRDPWAVTLLVNTLIASGIEVHRAGAPFRADGVGYPAGTFVVPMAQPARAHVKDLFERQAYPDRREYPGGPPVPPYDAAGWTLPLQMGISTPAITDRFAFQGEVVSEATVVPGTTRGRGPQRVLANRANAESRTLVEALRAGARAWLTAAPIPVDGTILPAGSVVLEHESDPAALDALVAAHAEAFGFDAWATSGLTPQSAVVTRVPRIGLYRPWTASMDEGWSRWVLEQHGIPAVSVTDSMVRAGGLGAWLDVLVLPDESDQSIVRGRSRDAVPPAYAGGIGDRGAENIREFVNGGGVLVATEASTAFAMSRLRLPVADGLAPGSRPNGAADVYAPGSVFMAALERGGPLTSGMDDSVAVYYANSAAFSVRAPARAVLRYSSAPLRSGFAQNAERLAGQAAVVDVPSGRGRVVLFGFRPLYRGQSHATFKLLFNAVLLSAAR